MTGTIGQRVADQARRSFVGREAELAALDAFCRGSRTGAGQAPLVAVLHGPGGVGKTRLLHTALAGLGEDVKVTVLDGRDVEPTPRGVCSALRQSLALDQSSSQRDRPDDGDATAVALSQLDAVFQLAAAFAESDRYVLAIDTYEVLGLIDSWLRTTLLPALPSSVVTVLVGRDRPAHAWHTAPGWAGNVVELRLGPLEDGEAHELLRARGLDAATARRANDYARGHPLALELAAAAARAGSHPPPSPVTAGGPVARDLLGTFVDTLSFEQAEALEAASAMRRVTEPLLGAVLGARAPGQPWRGPFRVPVEAAPRGDQATRPRSRPGTALGEGNNGAGVGGRLPSRSPRPRRRPGGTVHGPVRPTRLFRSPNHRRRSLPGAGCTRDERGGAATRVSSRCRAVLTVFSGSPPTTLS